MNTINCQSCGKECKKPKSGVRKYCLSCARESRRETYRNSYHKNRDTKIIGQRAYYRRNAESIKQRSAIYKSSNRERYNAHNKRYYAEGKEAKMFKLFLG